MFKKSRRRIIAAIMAAFIFAMAGVFIVIYAASYGSVQERNISMLEKYAELYFKNGAPSKPGMRPSGGLPKDADELPADDDGPEKRVFALSTFYGVSIKNGVTNVFDNDGNTSISDDRLGRLAESCAASGTKSGESGGLLYVVREQNGETLVAFMDATVISDTMATVIRYTLIFGGCALCVLLALSLLISRLIMKPLVKSDERQRQFVSDAGHELKTPVSIISANTELLSREIGPNKWLDNIRFENDRMSDLTHQLLELATAEQAKPVFAEFDLSRAVTGCVLPFEGAAFERGTQLLCDIAPGIRFTGDEKQLGQLVTILVDNALSHSSAGSTVRVSLSCEHGLAALLVTNEGKPIGDCVRIFERFYRADEARAEDSGHYGLGLAIAKAVTEANRGVISAESRGGVNTFKAVFPLRTRKNK